MSRNGTWCWATSTTTPTRGLLAELAARGAYLAFDRPGRIKYAPDSDSVALLVAVAERGGADRLLLGCATWPGAATGAASAAVRAWTTCYASSRRACAPRATRTWSTPPSPSTRPAPSPFGRPASGMV
ncbi:phosphotriesterase family protein [Fodinicola feengrottensis]|uniref:phosphotriesterase family protein n=1 Tax=Fodinicola feengrottensis TaxID=435914 RepID=UPI0036F3B669